MKKRKKSEKQEKKNTLNFPLLTKTALKTSFYVMKCYLAYNIWGENF